MKSVISTVTKHNPFMLIGVGIGLWLIGYLLMLSVAFGLGVCFFLSGVTALMLIKGYKVKVSKLMIIVVLLAGFFVLKISMVEIKYLIAVPVLVLISISATKLKVANTL
ncbi:hypothetical protein [Vibrio coralliilyticus]|uniref:hypothetical protein n=1 Tax=Vibrio coralliilyticus TaxID=190893 RepID=UPI000C1680B1|nr:hypothetical protein [Vibrio coralliilyticus]